MNKKGLMSPVNRKFEYGIKYEEEGRREGPPAYGRAAAKAGTEFAAARAEAGTEAGLHPLQQELLRPPHPGEDHVRPQVSRFGFKFYHF